MAVDYSNNVKIYRIAINVGIRHKLFKFVSVSYIVNHYLYDSSWVQQCTCTRWQHVWAAIKTFVFATLKTRFFVTNRWRLLACHLQEQLLDFQHQQQQHKPRTVACTCFMDFFLAYAYIRVLWDWPHTWLQYLKSYEHLPLNSCNCSYTQQLKAIAAAATTLWSKGGNISIR